MKPIVTLFKKEFKEHRLILFFLVVATVVLDLYLLLTGSSDSAKPLWVLAPYSGTLIILPFLLAHAFTSEWKSDTAYVLLALPIRPFWIPVLKFLALLCYAGILFGISTLGGYLVYVRFYANHVSISTADFWLWSALFYFSWTLLFFSLVTLMEAAKFSVHRYRGLLGTAVFFGTLFFWVRLSDPAVRWLDRIGHYTLTLRIEGELITQTIRFGEPLWIAITGAVLLGLAVLLFETKVEV